MMQVHAETQLQNTVIISMILEHGTNFRKYVIPKSKVERYDGTDIYLSIPRSMLSTFDF